MGWEGASFRGRKRVRAAATARLALLVVPLLLSGLPIGAFGLGASPGRSPPPDLGVAGPSPYGLPNETVTVQNLTIGNLSDFWGVGVNPGYNLTNFSGEVLPTPVQWVVWPAGDVADQYNMVNGTFWNNGVPSPALTDESQFVAACRSVSCHAIFTVPGEIDNPGFGAYEV